MARPRIVVVAADAERRAAIASSLAALGEIDARATGDGAAATLCVVDVAGDTGPLPSCPTIAIMPGAPLATIVDLLHRFEQVVTAITDVSSVVDAAVRVLGENPAGLARWLAPETSIETTEIADAAEQRQCLARIAEWLRDSGVSEKTRLHIEQCVDEMTINALYAAPVDEKGARVFEHVSIRARRSLRTEQRVVVSFGADAHRLGITVHDAFGSLRRDVVLRHLDKGVHAAVDQKASGAGMGLFLLANGASTVWFDVLPGVGTDVTCMYDRDRAELLELGAITRDPGNRPKTRPVRRAIRIFPPWVRAAAAVAALGVVALLALGVVRIIRGPDLARFSVKTQAGASVAVDGRFVGVASDKPLVTGSFATGRAYRIVVSRDGFEPAMSIVQGQRGTTAIDMSMHPVAVLEIESEPAGAVVSVDGTRLGATPLQLTALKPGSAVSIALESPGYRRVELHANVPVVGGHEHVTRVLELDPNSVRVRFVSEPEGASIVRAGELATAEHTFTPAELVIPTGLLQHFELHMPGFAPLAIPAFEVTSGSAVEPKGGELQPVD